MADPLTLTVITTAASVGTSFLSGMEQSRQLEFQARQQETQAKLDELRAKEQAVAIRERLRSDLATANAAFAARGVQSSGSAEAANIEARRAASLDIETARFGGAANAAQARGQAKELRSGKKGAILGGALKATGALVSGTQSYLDIKAKSKV